MEETFSRQFETTPWSNGYLLEAFGFRAGQGHLTQADEIGNGNDLMAILYQYARTEAETRAALKLNFINDIVPTRHVPGILNSAGIRVVNALMNPAYHLASMLDPARDGEYPWNITYPAERQLAEVFARYVNDTKPDALVFTLTSGARIANVAKAKGLIRADLPIYNIVCDPLGPELTHGIYDPRTEFGIDPYTINLVGDQRTYDIFRARGYSEQQVRLVDTAYIRTEAEEAIVDAKLDDYEYFKQFGPAPDRPLLLSVVHDSFRTKFETSVSHSLYADYRDEAESGKIFLALTLDPEQIPQFTQDHKFAVIRTAEELEDLLKNRSARSGLHGAVIVKPEVSNDMAVHRNYSRIQRLLALYSHVSVSRPSEHPRTAARFDTPSLTTLAFASQEVYMDNVYRRQGFAGNWTQISRKPFPALMRAAAGLSRLDLADPASYQELLRMALAGGDCRKHSSIQQIQQIIYSDLRQLPVAQVQTY